MEDRTLLEDYRARQSQAAFTHLVERHLALVYSTALRITRQPALAEDVAQTVFITLARQAHRVRDPAALPGWLYRAVCHTAYNALRAEKRRRANETAAMQTTDLHQTSAAAWERLASLLDEAMARLNAADQNMVVQRFFEGRSLREVGEAFGLSDDAAQKRIHRAVEKLRNYFAKNGVVVPAVALIPVISEHVVLQPPAHLTAKITTLTSTATAAGGGFTFLKLLTLMSHTKIKIGLVSAVIIAIFALFIWHKWNFLGTSSEISSQGSASSAKTTPGLTSPPRQVETPAIVPVPATTAKNTGVPEESTASSTEMDSLLADATARQILTAHQKFIRALVTVSVVYANKNGGRIPPDPFALLPQQDSQTTYYPFSVGVHRDMARVKDATRTVIITDVPFPFPTGEWVKTYGFADGHIETATSANNDFRAWEAEHTDPNYP